MHPILNVGRKADGFFLVPPSISNSVTSIFFFQSQNHLSPRQRVPGDPKDAHTSGRHLHPWAGGVFAPACGSDLLGAGGVWVGLQAESPRSRFLAAWRLSGTTVWTTSCSRGKCVSNEVTSSHFYDFGLTEPPGPAINA